MSVWGKIGKGLLAAAPFAAMAIPGVGPAMGGFMKAGGIGSKILKGAAAFAPVLGGMAKGRAEGKAQEVQDTLARDRLNLAAAQGNVGTPRRRLGNVAAGSISAASPVVANWGGPGSGLAGNKLRFTGGFMDRDPRMTQMGNAIMEQEMQKQLRGEPEFAGATPAPRSGLLDKILGIGSGVSGILGAASTFLKPGLRDSTDATSSTMPVGTPYTNPDLLRLGGDPNEDPFQANLRDSLLRRRAARAPLFQG